MIKTRTLKIVYIALFTALMAAGAYIKIPTPLVPITMQSAFAAMAGLTLGPVLGSISVLLYIALGLLGLPVFTSGGGFSYIFAPTFGYILGFVLCAFVSGILIKLFKRKNFFTYAASGIIGALTVYLPGLPYLYMIVPTISAQKLFISCFLIFLPGDILTTAVTAFAAYSLKKISVLHLK